MSRYDASSLLAVSKRHPARAFVVLLLTTALLVTGCDVSITINGDDDSSSIQGSGRIETRSFDLPAFDAIDASNALSLEIEVRSDQGVEAQIDDNLIDLLMVEVRDKTLYLSCERCEPSPGAVLKVSAEPLEHIALSGATRAELATLESKTLSLMVSGASRVEMTGGSVAEVSATVSGASSFKATPARIGRLQIDLSGASQAEIAVSDEVAGRVSGASTLQVSREFDPDVNVVVTGASRLLQ